MHAPRRHAARLQHLVLVIPAALIELDDAAALRLAVKTGPAVRRDEQRGDLVRVVRKQLPQNAHEIAIGDFLEIGHPRCQREDAVLAQQADRFAVGLGVAPFLIFCSVASSVFSMPSRKRSMPALRYRCRMSASRTMSSARVEPMMVIGMFSAISASHSAPGRLVDGRVLVREIEQLHAVRAVQPGDFFGELERIAMPPARPEPALAAVVALVRAAARELHHDRALAAVIAVARWSISSQPTRKASRSSIISAG